MRITKGFGSLSILAGAILLAVVATATGDEAEKEAKPESLPSHTMLVRHGYYLLLRQGDGLAAIKLVNKSSDPGSADLSYESHYWRDGNSQSFKENHSVGHGSLFEKYVTTKSIEKNLTTKVRWNFREVRDDGSQRTFDCGPFHIEWSFATSDSSWVYLRTDAPDYSLAITRWEKVEEIKAVDPKLKWITPPGN